MTIYEFSYTDCIYESTMWGVSLHKTQKGAEIAMEHHKNEARKEFNKREAYNENWNVKFGVNEAWAVNKREVKD